MARLLKGFYLTTSAYTSTSTFDPDVLYFVREDASGETGYLQFNGKKYGCPTAALDELNGKIEELSGATGSLETFVGTLPPGAEGPVIDYLLGAISGLSGDIEETIGQLSAATISEVSRLDGRIDDLSGVTEAFSAATESALTQLRADMTVTISGYTESGETSDTVKKYSIKQGGTEIGVIEVPADIFVDKGTLITVDNEGKVTDSQDTTLYPIGTEIPQLVGKAGTYVAIKFVNDEQSVVFIDVTKLIDIYTVESGSTNYLEIDGYEVGTKIIPIASANTASTGLLDAWDVKQYVDSQSGGAAEKIQELSGVTEAFSAATEAEIQRIDGDVTAVSGRVDELSAATVNKVVVNGYESTFADNTATVNITASSVTLGETVSGNSADATVTSVLTNIYGELSRIDAAAYEGVESADSAITVSAVENNKQTISLKTETATNATVAAGHLEVVRNENGELYAQMYYAGDDVEGQNVFPEA